MKKKTLSIIPLLVATIILLSPHEAKAWRLFGKDVEHEWGTRDGNCGGVHRDGGFYLFGIRVWDWREETPTGCV